MEVLRTPCGFSPHRMTVGTHSMLAWQEVKGDATDASASEREMPTSAAFSAPQSLAPSPHIPTQYPAELGGSELEADVGCSQSRAQWGTRWGVPPWHSQRYPPRPAVPIHSLPSARRWAQGWWRLCILLPVPIVALGTHSAIAAHPCASVSKSWPFLGPTQRELFGKQEKNPTKPN